MSGPWLGRLDRTWMKRRRIVEPVAFVVDVEETL
jgi:hypothetical protein